MDYRIIVDSCVDIHEAPEGAPTPVRIPFTVHIDGNAYQDCGNEVTSRLFRPGYIAKSIHTACPSPGDFIEALEGAKRAFIITISAQLSGAHAAAVAACQQLTERLRGACDIHVIDSETASAGETMLVLKLHQLIAENLSSERIAARLTEYAGGLRTLFVAGTLDTLIANGRVKPIEGFALRKLKICPIMGEDGHGKIELKAFARGRARALARLVDMIGESGRDLRDEVLGITHVNALESARALKKEILARYPFKSVLIFEAAGLSSVYAGDGGIVLAY